MVRRPATDEVDVPATGRAAGSSYAGGEAVAPRSTVIPVVVRQGYGLHPDDMPVDILKQESGRRAAWRKD